MTPLFHTHAHHKPLNQKQDKVEVNGQNAAPVFNYLKEKQVKGAAWVWV